MFSNLKSTFQVYSSNLPERAHNFPRLLRARSSQSGRKREVESENEERNGPSIIELPQ